MKLTQPYGALTGALLLAVLGCTGTAPNTGVGERLGAKGRIVGYLYDFDTGAPANDVTVKTRHLGTEVTATTADGFFVLDGLAAGATYRVLMSKDGYVTRFANVTVAQVPQDAYDAVGNGNLGAVGMAKPSGTLTGRVEFLTAQPDPTPIAGATVVADLVTNGSFMLTKTATTTATGAFTLDGLPAAAAGLSINFCVLSGPEAGAPHMEFQPTCPNATLYSGRTTFVAVRPSRTDVGAGDVNLVQGVVRDVRTRLPLADVQVFEVGRESAPVVTDANGYYLLKTPSTNRYAQFVYRKTGFAEGYLELNLGRGSTQTNNVNLAPGGASIAGKLTYANLQPANQAEVRIDLRTSGYNVFKTVRTNPVGDFVLDELPGLVDGLNVNVSVTPWSADPDLYPETAPQTFQATLYPGAATQVYRQLLSNATLAVVANNAYSGFIGTAEAVQVQMSLPTVPADNSFTLQDGSGQTMPFTTAYADSNRRITVTPLVASGQPLWSENRNYTLTLRLRANNGPQGLFQTSFSFTPRTSLATANITGRIAVLTVDSPDVDSSTRTLTYRWAPLPDAFSYSLYVRTVNTARLPAYTRVTTTTAQPSPSASINLGSLSFTAALEPAQGHPFAFGQVLGFLVVPVDSRGLETDASKGATLELRDVVPPRFNLGVAQLDGPTGPRFVLSSNEPLDRTTPPTVTLPGGLTAGDWVVDEAVQGQEGTLSTTGTAGSGTLSVQLRDTSGNLSQALAVPVFAQAPIASPGFEGSSQTCSLSGWTAEPNVDCGACPAQALPAPGARLAVPGVRAVYEGVCALSLGDAETLSCGTQVVHTPLDLSGAAFDRRTVVLQSRAWANSSLGNGSMSVALRNTTTMSTTSLYGLSAFTTQRTWFTFTNDVTGAVGASHDLRVTYASSACNSRASVQVDDLRLYVR